MNYSKLNFDNVDAYLVTSEYNRYYLTGFHSSYGVFLGLADETYYITDNRYKEVCNKHFADSSVIVKIIDDGVTDIDVINQVVAEKRIKKMGFEDTMSVREFEDFKKAVAVEFVPSGETIEMLRGVKTECEIAKMKAVMELSSRAFDNMCENIKAGMTEKEMCAELNYQIYRLGADSLAFETIVASGVNGSMPHAVPSDKVVENGELVTFDFGGRKDGYCADITRTIAIGEISEEQKKLYNTVLESQLIGLKNVKAGVTGKHVDAMVREYFDANGVEEYFTHGLGHGVGVEIHEFPRLSKKSNTVLEEGMVVTVEPGLYIPGSMGCRIEDTVVVTKDGYINMATCSKELRIIKA